MQKQAQNNSALLAFRPEETFQGIADLKYHQPTKISSIENQTEMVSWSDDLKGRWPMGRSSDQGNLIVQFGLGLVEYRLDLLILELANSDRTMLDFLRSDNSRSDKIK